MLPIYEAMSLEGSQLTTLGENSVGRYMCGDPVSECKRGRHYDGE